MLDIDVVAPGFERLFDSHPPLDLIAQNLMFGEGPVWDRRTQQLYWVDIIGNAVWKWKPGVGREIVLKDCGHPDGMTFDQQGRLLVAGWSLRTVWRFEKDGTITTLASRYRGKKLNTPNDIVVKSDGSIYWTDMASGLIIPGMVAQDCQRYLDMLGVMRLAPDGSEVQCIIEDCMSPNGIAFSPDESLLYVNESRANLIRVFDVRSDGTVGAGRLFHKLEGNEPGVADGMKVDTAGNVYCTGPGGIHVIDAGGKLLGRLKIPGHSTNLAWGDEDWQSLYVTTHESVYRTRAKVPGMAVW
jgi:gluconolactonase